MLIAVQPRRGCSDSPGHRPGNRASGPADLHHHEPQRGSGTLSGFMVGMSGRAGPRGVAPGYRLSPRGAQKQRQRGTVSHSTRRNRRATASMHRGRAKRQSARARPQCIGAMAHGLSNSLSASSAFAVRLPPPLNLRRASRRTGSVLQVGAASQSCSHAKPASCPLTASAVPHKSPSPQPQVPNHKMLWSKYYQNGRNFAYVFVIYFFFRDYFRGF